jgi:hypothetical protein
VEKAAIDVDPDEALTVALAQETHVLSLRGGRIEVVGEDTSVPVDMERLHIGRSQRCALVLDDPTVSKVHAEVQATPRGVHLVDLNSLNGTFIGEASIVEAYMTGSCEFRCGAKRLRFVPEPVREVQIEAPKRFGGLVGSTPEMTELFAKLQRYSPTSMSMVIRGETGTGKERVAQAIHDASPQARQALCRRQLRCGRRYLAGSRALRSCPRRVHGSGSRPRRPLRRSRWRDAAVR